jgi:hypothetical protein
MKIITTYARFLPEQRWEDVNTCSDPIPAGSPRPPLVMRSLGIFLFAFVLGLSGCGAQFTHVKPGQSAWLSLARVPPVVANPETDPHPNGLIAAARRRPPAVWNHVEPPLPMAYQDPLQASSADVFGPSESAALTEMEQKLLAHPASAEDWRKLAILYEQAGDTLGAVRAFKEVKKAGLAPSELKTRTGASLGLR